jgi:hypothetical protein
LVDAHIQADRGGTLIFHASEQIWAGLWVTGLNGTLGQTNIDYDPKFPLPGTRSCCLLSVLDGPSSSGLPHRIGQTDDQGELFLKINDDVYGNGGGASRFLIRQHPSYFFRSATESASPDGTGLWCPLTGFSQSPPIPALKYEWASGEGGE